MQPEEQVYFECQNDYTEDFIKDSDRFILFSTHRGRLHIFFWPLYASIIALLCLFRIFSAYTALTFAAIAVVMSIIRSNRKRVIRKAHQRTMVSNNGMQLRVRLQFTQAGFYTENMDNGNRKFMSYEHFSRCIAAEHIAMLITSANTWYEIDLRTLTGGTRKEFLVFLWQHCPLLKRKKELGEHTGKVINGIVVTLLIFSILAAIVCLPSLYLRERLSGTIGNHMSYAQIADKLETVGITGADEALIATLEEEYGDLSKENYQPYEEVQLMLAYLGDGSYSDRTGWTPSTNGVYWFDLEAWDPEYMYTYCLEGIAALDPELLQFYGVRETYDRAAINTGIGTGEVSFTFNKEKHTISVDVEYDWFDPAFLDSLSQIIGSEDGKQLYFAADGGQGLFVFYRDAQWAKEFTKLTGMKLCTATEDLRY